MLEIRNTRNRLVGERYGIMTIVTIATHAEFRLSWTHEIDDTPVVNYSSSFARRNFTNCRQSIAIHRCIFGFTFERFIPEKWPTDVFRRKEKTERKREKERKLGTNSFDSMAIVRAH